jgi:hypothetical protein
LSVDIAAIRRTLKQGARILEGLDEVISRTSTTAVCFG